MNNCKSFKPSIDNNSKVLILGSMPGAKSLEEQQYYAHPQNRFWKVMGSICNEPKLSELDYETKLQILLNNNIALWDTIKSCKREGSLDSDIQNEKPNDITGLLKKYPNIKTICLTGINHIRHLKNIFLIFWRNILAIKCLQPVPQTQDIVWMLLQKNGPKLC